MRGHGRAAYMWMLTPPPAPQFLPRARSSIAEALRYLWVLRATGSRGADLLLVPSMFSRSWRDALICSHGVCHRSAVSSQNIGAVFTSVCTLCLGVG